MLRYYFSGAAPAELGEFCESNENFSLEKFDFNCMYGGIVFTQHSFVVNFCVTFNTFSNVILSE